MVNRMNFDDQIADLILGVEPGGLEREQTKGDETANVKAHEFSLYRLGFNQQGYYIQERPRVVNP